MSQKNNIHTNTRQHNKFNHSNESYLLQELRGGRNDVCERGGEKEIGPKVGASLRGADMGARP